jgi:hypothetical protein
MSDARTTDAYTASNPPPTTQRHRPPDTRSTAPVV